MKSAIRTGVAVTTGALVATALATSPAAVGAVPGSDWDGPVALGAADPGGDGGVDIAVSADGSRALAGWWLRGDTTVAEWDGSSWSPPTTISTAGHEFDADPDVELSADGRTALVGWSGEVGEGISPVFVAARGSDRWARAQRLGWAEHYFGEGSLALASDGSRALASWSQLDPEDWTEEGLKVSRWNGATWDTTTLSRRNSDAAPVVALSQDGRVALVMWPRNGGVHAAWWRGGAWSAPERVLTAPYDYAHLRLALSDDGSTAVATLGVMRDDDIDPGRLRGLEYRDGGGWTATSLGTGWPGDIATAADGSSALFSWDLQPDPLDDPTLRGVGSWLPGSWTKAQFRPPTTYFAQRGSPQLAMSADGSRATATWTNVPGADADASVWVSEKSGSAWGEAERLAVCAGTWNCPADIGMAASTFTQFAIFAYDDQVFVTSKAGLPGKVRKIRVKVKPVSAHRGKAIIRWKAAVNADSYQVKVSKPKGKKFPKRWKQVTKRKYVAKVKLGKKYVVKVRGVGPAGVGPKKKKKFWT